MLASMGLIKNLPLKRYAFFEAEVAVFGGFLALANGELAVSGLAFVESFIKA